MSHINFKLLRVIFLCYVFVIVLFMLEEGDASDTSPVLQRTRRYLGFMNVTKFYIKVNWKNNMLAWNQLFAEAIGYKLSYDDPHGSVRPFKHFQRREVYSQLEMLMDKIGVNGFHCIRRAVCEIKMLNTPKGIYQRILKIVFRQQSAQTDRWHDISDEDCGMSTAVCPISVLDVSLYTDM